MKPFLFVSCAVLCACTPFDNYDFDRGKSDGHKACLCMSSASANAEQCFYDNVNSSMVNEASAANITSDYVAGLMTEQCMREYLTLYMADFERGKRDGALICECMQYAASQVSRDRCPFIDALRLADGAYVIEEELAKMERAGYVTDYAAGLLTHPCMLDYLLRNNYLPY